MALTCSRCGQKQGIMAVFSADLNAETYICPSCTAAVKREQEEQAREQARTEQTRLELVRELAKKVILTTTHTIDGHRVTKYLGIESVEFVIGTGLFSEITTDFQDFLGQRSTAFERKLQGAKKTAFDTLAMVAAERGANAILGIDVDYTEFSGNRIGLVVNGTLVEIARVS